MGIDSLGPGRFKLDRTCAHHSPRGPATEDPGILLVPGHRASRLVAVFCDRATPIHSTKETDPARHSRRHYFSSGLLLLPSFWSSLLNYLTNLPYSSRAYAPHAPSPPTLPCASPPKSIDQLSQPWPPPPGFRGSGAKGCSTLATRAIPLQD